MSAALQPLNHRQLPSGFYRLLWRHRTLVVRHASPIDQTGMAVRDFDWAVGCLRRSPVRRVKLGTNLSAADLTFWANVCAAAGCEVYLSLPGDASLPQKRKPVHWRIKCIIDRLVALFSLILLLPLFLGVSVLIRQASSESILVRRWQVGARGRLYRVFYFRTQTESGKPFAFAPWVRRYRFDRLPKLLNVLRGEMSIVGACPRWLSGVPQIEPQCRDRLNALPGITGAWMLESRLGRLNPSAQSQLGDTQLDYRLLYPVDVQYLWSWSLRGDLGYLLLTAPRILVAQQY